MPQIGPGQQLCWIVQIAEIEKVLPCLGYGAFLEDVEDSKRTIKSRIFTKPPMVTWFKIPFVKVDSEVYEPILARILHEEFPDDITFDEKGKCRLISDLSETPHVTTNIPSVSNVKNIDALREEFEKLPTSDCWDDSSDEDN